MLGGVRLGVGRNNVGCWKGVRSGVGRRKVGCWEV